MPHHSRCVIDPHALRALAMLSLSAAFVIAAAADASAQLRTRLYASGFNAPVAFVQDPSDRTIQYVVEQGRTTSGGGTQGARILALHNGTATVFLDLSGAVQAGGEQGLLGLAFPPDYGASGRFYVFFTAPGAGSFVNRSTVARFKRSTTNPLVADPSTRKDLVWSTGLPYIQHNAGNHNGGNMAFGPDGFLYIGTGDGGGGNDQFLHAQNPNSLLGKMLRIDVSVPDGDAKGFSIPASNPFPPGNTLGALPEIWAFGLRNPWRWSFDDPSRGGTGALVIADVGQAAWEEVNYEPAARGGRNYGWAAFEGTHPTGLGRPLAFGPAVNPIHEYSHAFGISITGGYVYRGLRLGATFRGRYFFADFGSGRVWSLGLNIDGNGEAQVANIVEHTGELGGVGNVSAFGVDADGELYIVDYSGRILAIDGPHSEVAGDVDGDFRTDLVVWRPTDGVWYTAHSSSGYTTGMATPFGSSAAGDVPLMGDFDGDGQRDFATWRATTGTFGWVLSSTNYTSGGSQPLGNQSLGDIPLVGDFDGDGRSDLVVWRSSTGEWFWLTSSSNYAGAAAIRRWGGPGDVPLLADFDGDGRADITVWRPSTGEWFWLKSTANWFAADTRRWGGPGDQPLLGDFDGDRLADITVFRPSTGQWFWITSGSGYRSGFVTTWGGQGDVPLLADFDEDGRADITVWRPSTGQWFWLTSTSGFRTGFVRAWGSGSVGDVPVVK